MIELDFGTLPTILQHRMFYGMPAFVEDPLAAVRLPETVDRLRAASFFLGHVSAEDPPWRSRAYLRAGLNEFRSVAQSLNWDMGRRDVHSPEKSTNPLVHLVFRLRRLAVYVANAKTSPREVTASLTIGELTTSADIKILLIDNLRGYISQERLSAYHPEDIARICDWFDEAQQQWGASQLLDIGVLQYCQELAAVYRDRATSPTPPNTR
jgi:hypothetical protein